MGKSDGFLRLPKLMIVYRYFLFADQMRKALFKSLKQKEYRIGMRDINEYRYYLVFHFGEPGIYMSLYYASLFVVIEGWKELGFSDPTIDSLIKSDNVTLLRRFRNSVFHFQKNFPSAKWLELIDQGEASASWILELRNAFSKYFLDEKNWESTGLVIPEGLKKQIKKANLLEIEKIVDDYMKRRDLLEIEIMRDNYIKGIE